ncbi:MAG: multi antimicrobial extrusion protein MatE [bacterium]|nr:MAG: multi antimicrobial extrusion protein MatE [bacterium]
MNFKLDISKLKGDGVGAVLARGAGGAFVAKVLAAGLAFGAQVALARIMGAESFGVYIYVISWITILTILGKVGLDASALRFVSSYVAHEEWSLLRGFFHRSRQIFTIASIFIAAIVASVVLVFQSKLSDELVFTFLAGCLLLPVLVSLQVHAAFLQGFKKIVQSQAPQFVVRPLLIVGGIFFMFIMAEQAISSYMAMFIDMLATLCALLITYFYFAVSLADKTPKIQKVQKTYHTNKWLQVSMPLLLLSCFTILLSQTDIVMLGMIKGTTDSGIYAAASRTSHLISFGLMAVNAIAAPMISQLYSQGRMDELQRMVKLAAIAIMTFSLPISFAMIVWGEQLLSLFGQSFTAGYHSLVILIAGQLVNSLAGSVGLLMTMTGHHKEAAYVFGISALLNIILNAVLIPMYGLLGAAFATAFTTSLWNVILIVYVRKKININPTMLAGW